MHMRFSALSLAVIFMAAPLCGETLLHINTASWSGSGSADGWSFDGLGDPYSEGAIKFDKGSSAVISPRFPGDLLGIAITYKSSAENPPRLLHLTAYSGDAPVYGPTNLTPSASNPRALKNYVRQEFVLNAELGADGFRLMLGDGASGNWGVAAIDVAFVANRAYGLHARRAGSTSFIAAWSNGSEVASSEVRVIATNTVPFSADYREFYDFSFISNPSGNLRSVADDITGKWPVLGGFELNAPADSEGVFMIGSSTKTGLLTLAHPGTCSDKQLVITANRFVTKENDEGNVMPVFFIADGVTNDLAVLTIGDSPENYCIPLATVPDGAVLAISSVTNRVRSGKANARTIIHTIGLAESVTPQHVETNEIVRVSSPTNWARVGGLEPDSDYLWSVRGVDAAGNPSRFAVFIPLHTRPLPGNLLMFIR